jgi:predicted O-methyltransferase YrrM
VNRSTQRERARMIAASAIKSVAFRTGLHRAVFYRYDYMFQPAELAFLVSCLTRTHGLPGPIVEIGCAGGNTTVFLNKHLDDLADRRSYLCVDTFEGFTDDDIAVETARGKDAERYRYIFRAYRQSWFDRTIANNGISRVRSIKADVNEHDFGDLRDISFCLIDVDLKRPVERSLEELVPRMAPGGIVVVDDCASDNKFDGALAAYAEFTDRHDLPMRIENGTLGVIEIPGA